MAKTCKIILTIIGAESISVSMSSDANWSALFSNQKLVMDNWIKKVSIVPSKPKALGRL